MSTFSQSVCKQTLRLPCMISSSRPLPLRAASIGNGCWPAAVWLFGCLAVWLPEYLFFSFCVPKARALLPTTNAGDAVLLSRPLPLLFLSLPQLGFSRRPAPRAPGAHRRRRRTSSAARLPSLLCQLLFYHCCCCSTSEVAAAEITAATREARLPFLVLVLCMCVFVCVCVCLFVHHWRLVVVFTCYHFLFLLLLHPS